MMDGRDDPAGRRTSEDPANSGVTGSAIDPTQSELEDDELGVPATQATGGLVPEGADDDQP